MILYEVNLEIETSIAEEFRSWLMPHMKEVLQAGGFSSANLYKDTSKESPTTVHLCVHYITKDQQLLDAYLQNHAPRLRQDALDRFGQQFRANRRILQLEASAHS